ncbi:MAG: FAD-dependent oxidoreductase [Bryobacteraceae bacterium]|nr:FAD-dependent oxidoreductase [Bryobacteraceae bacterium]
MSSENESRRVLIVGGVAGGASCAARTRRLDESAEIVLFDRGPYVSFANCGLPYYVGDIIKQEADLLVASAKTFLQNFNIDVRTENEVTAIDRHRREIEVKDKGTGRVYRERYDTLVLATGAAPLQPRLPGIDLPGIHVLRTIPDSRRIRDWIETRNPRRAVIVGGGYIGIEMAENLVKRGIRVTIVEALDQLMPPLDPEMAEPVARHLEEKKINVEIGDPVEAFEPGHDGGIVVRTKSGGGYPGDMVILSVGVRPEISLAQAAGLELGECGGLRVDESMRTSDPRIWAVGDVVETRDIVTGTWMLAPLAGPANRQGRIAAESICGREAKFRGVQGTVICGCLGLTVAMTGASEKRLRQAGFTRFKAVYLHPGSHAGYYPGATPIHIKLIFSTDDGRVLGAQAVGVEGVDKRIDVIAMAIQKGATVYDLAEAELCYAPQYGAAKDPVNLAGMVAVNVLRGDLPLADWRGLPHANAFLLDVRAPEEYARDHIEGAVNIPLTQLRERYGELPRDREIWINCALGQRSYYAVRFLAQKGYNVKNLPGGLVTYWGFYP